MQFLTASAKPGRKHVLTLLLIMLMHLALWQAIRHPGLYGRAHTRDDVVAYLDVLNIMPPRPKPPVTDTPPAKVVTITTLAKPPAARNTRQTPEAKGPSSSPATTPPPVVETDQGNTDNNNNTPSLDLDALRSSALAMDRQRKPGEIEQMQASHRRSDTLEKRLGEGAKRAEKKECLKAFSGLGLLAVIPLAVSTVVDTGCKW
ncbi:hypothetical protein H8L32_05095 [Undibacterium sp. CY18W]|uniref:Uncharacterized protein n=1 Tax=Undibacterium hunanense TaxID=2762292 RepID=A0ABR6ZMM7_9BURK|nr:hypothetical protein [Undibacterium hunanense]MBC3916844.1 hypothetical protein [Undibacterium hunanense]